MGPSRSRPLMAPLAYAVDRKLRSPFMNIFKRCESDSMRVRRSRLNLAPNRGMNAQRSIRLVESLTVLNLLPGKLISRAIQVSFLRKLAFFDS